VKHDASRILAFSCLHFPYQHKNALTFLKHVKQDHKPTLVVCLGDMTDLHQLSTHPKNPNCLSAADEIKQARECLRAMAVIFPKMLVCESNHDTRIIRKGTHEGLPKECLKTWREVMGIPDGWKQHWEHDLGPAMAIHGDRYSGANGIRNAVSDNMMSTVMGHIHTEAGVFWQETKAGLYWGLQAGCLIDHEYDAFEYQRTNRKRPLLGCGVVIDNVPHWVPLQ
jgi:predicted phosphodiesterase